MTSRALILPLVAALASPFACSSADDPGPRAPFVEATELSAQPMFAHGEMPGPAQRRGARAVAQNRACEKCHQAEAAEWRGSLHQRAHKEPAYQRSFAIEPLPFCRACHAPEGDPEAEPQSDVGELGVGCVTCHGIDDVLAAPRADSHGDRAPHGVVRDARFAGVEACGNCHQFQFPESLGSKNPVDLMQSTVFEHSTSPDHGESCASCHMPTENGRRSHAFRSSRDPSVLKASLKIAVTRRSATTIAVELTPVGVGHAFPTGDLFRRLELRAEAFGPDRMLIAQKVHYLARHFERTPTTPRRLVADDRLRGPETIVLDLGPEAANHPIAWRVGYQRVAHPNGISEESAELEGDIELASGDIP